MIIEVKSTKAPVDQAGNPYSFTEERPSRTPLVLSLMLTGMALYLKTVLPGWGQPEKYAPAEPEAEENKASPTLVPISSDNILGFAIDPASGGETPGAGSGFAISRSRQLDHTTPASFMMIRSPEVDQVQLAVPETSTFAPIDLRSDNDNGASPQLGGGAGGRGPERPRSPEEPTDQGEDAPRSPEQPTDEVGGVGPGDHDNNGTNPLDHDGGGDGVIPDTKDDDDDDDNEDETLNRAPRVSGPVYLNEVYGCMAAFIGLSELLRNATDPDGDALSIRNLTISSGILTQTPEGWSFSAALLGPVTLTYEVTDGAMSVVQHAYFNVVKNLPIIGTPGSDILVGTDCADDIDGSSGDDNIDGRGGIDTIYGGTGSDHIVAGSGNDVVRAGEGDDIVFGGDGEDWISGGKGQDRLFGGDGDDAVFGDEGDDALHGEQGDDLLFAGSGDDFAVGGAGRDFIDGGDGNDSLSGEEGDDILFGAAGADRLEGGAGNDRLSGQEGGDSLYAGDGDDTIVGDIDHANDYYDGGEGTDTLDYSAATHGVDVDLINGTASGREIGTDAVARVEIVMTGTGDDRIAGSDQSEVFATASGDDVIYDGGGEDQVDAGAGNDRVEAAADAAPDDFEGGEGTDTLDYSETRSGVLIDLQSHTATGVEVGSDTINGFENFIGGAGDDHFIVTEAPVSLSGGAGNDLFEFEALTSASENAQFVVHEI